MSGRHPDVVGPTCTASRAKRAHHGRWADHRDEHRVRLCAVVAAPAKGHCRPTWAGSRRSVCWPGSACRGCLLPVLDGAPRRVRPTTAGPWSAMRSQDRVPLFCGPVDASRRSRRPCPQVWGRSDFGSPGNPVCFSRRPHLRRRVAVSAGGVEDRAVSRPLRKACCPVSRQAGRHGCANLRCWPDGTHSPTVRALSGPSACRTSRPGTGLPRRDPATSGNPTPADCASGRPLPQPQPSVCARGTGPRVRCRWDHQPSQRFVHVKDRSEERFSSV